MRAVRFHMVVDQSSKCFEPNGLKQDHLEYRRAIPGHRLTYEFSAWLHERFGDCFLIGSHEPYGSETESFTKFIKSSNQYAVNVLLMPITFDSPGYRSWTYELWFKDHRDAVMTKLTWGGND